MLYFMGSSAHLSNGDIASNTNSLIASIIIIAALEANAIFGKQGPMTTVRGVIMSGLALTLVLWAVVYFL